MNPIEKAINKEFNLSIFERAAEITGSREGKATDSVAFVILQQNMADKDALLSVSHDTIFNSPVDYYLEVAFSLGFLPVYSEDIKGETLFVLYRKPGILLKFYTFRGKVGGGRFCYNWAPNDYQEYLEAIIRGEFITSSGAWTKEGMWAGYHDCREGLRFHINQFERFGKFIEPWVVYPYFSLCICYDEPGLSLEEEWAIIDKIQATRWQKFPDYIKLLAANCKDKPEWMN
jgi:hypothetical protein